MLTLSSYFTNASGDDSTIVFDLSRLKAESTTRPTSDRQGRAPFNQHYLQAGSGLTESVFALTSCLLSTPGDGLTTILELPRLECKVHDQPSSRPAT